jgi:hypothetical protein
MGLRGWLKRLERGSREDLASFVLEDGSRHYYDPQSGDLFLHSTDCLRAQGDCEPFPEPPETVKALVRARGDRRAALEQLYPGRSFGFLTALDGPQDRPGRHTSRGAVRDGQGRPSGAPWPDKQGMPSSEAPRSPLRAFGAGPDGLAYPSWERTIQANHRRTASA